MEKEPSFPRERLYVKNGEIIGDPNQGIKTRFSYRNICEYVAFLSNIEPKNVKEALEDDCWIIVMQKELNQFERSKVWNLVPKLNDHSIIGTKWIFRNKARLVAQRYSQEEGIDYEETYALVARLEAIRMLLAFACFKDFKWMSRVHF